MGEDHNSEHNFFEQDRDFAEQKPFAENNESRKKRKIEASPSTDLLRHIRAVMRAPLVFDAQDLQRDPELYRNDYGGKGYCRSAFASLATVLSDLVVQPAPTCWTKPTRKKPTPTAFTPRLFMYVELLHRVCNALNTLNEDET